MQGYQAVRGHARSWVLGPRTPNIGCQCWGNVGGTPNVVGVIPVGGCRVGVPPAQTGWVTGAAPVFLIGGGATAWLLVLVLTLQPAVRQLD